MGGGIVLVPPLIAVGLQRHQAHATSLAAIVLIATTGAVSFGVAGEVNVPFGITVGVGGVLGSVIGASLMNRVSAQALTLIFGAVLFAAGIRMISGAAPLPMAATLEPWLEVVFALLIGVIAGFFAGLTGIGGGVVIVPASVLLLGLDQKLAQGTSLVAIIFTALAGTLVNLKNSRVRLVDGLVVGFGGAVGSLAGTRLALLTPSRTLSVVFGIVVLFVATRTVWRLYRQPQSV